VIASNWRICVALPCDPCREALAIAARDLQQFLHVAFRIELASSNRPENDDTILLRIDPSMSASADSAERHRIAIGERRVVVEGGKASSSPGTGPGTSTSRIPSRAYWPRFRRT
jgi:hypothetical protein